MEHIGNFDDTLRNFNIILLEPEFLHHPEITPLGPTEYPIYADMYFFYSAHTTDYRANIQAMSGFCQVLIEEFDTMHREKNPYVLIYRD
jgi:hypothetical protein